jgi:tetratricopeptide (TPR) repeat protein
LAPDNIDIDMLQKGAKFLPTSLKVALSDPLKLDEVLGTLHRYSLLEASDGRDLISIHRLVQAVLRDRLPHRQKQIWMEASLRTVDFSFRFNKNDVNTWLIAATVLPHALAISSLYEKVEAPSEDIAKVLSDLLNKMGRYLRRKAQHDNSRNQFMKALAITEALYGPNHTTVALNLSDLSGVLEDLGDVRAARTNYERALAIYQAKYGESHEIVAIVLNNLGNVLRQLGDLQGARSNIERALAIGEAVYGPDHPEVAVWLNNLGSVLLDLGDLQGARSNYERALAISEAVYGPDHPKTLNVRRGLKLVKLAGNQKSS